MTLNLQEKDDVVVVTFQDLRILDQAQITEIGEEFKNLTLQSAADHKLLLNFDRVQFMSSSMIGQILRLSKMCKKDKVKLKLCNICPNIMEVFNLMGLRKVLDIHDTEHDAIEAFGQRRLGRFRR